MTRAWQQACRQIYHQSQLIDASRKTDYDDCCVEGEVSSGWRGVVPAPYFFWCVPMSDEATGAQPDQTDVSESQRTRAKNLRPHEKAEIIAIGRSKLASAEEVAERFGIHRKTVYRYWKEARVGDKEMDAEMQRKAAEAVVKEVVNEAALRAQKVKESRESKYKLGVFIQKLVQKTLVEAVTAKKDIGSLSNVMKTLQMAAIAAKHSSDEQFTALGVDPLKVDASDDLPELPIVELTDEQIREMQRRAMEKDAEIPAMDYLADDRVVEEDGELVEGGKQVK